MSGCPITMSRDSRHEPETCGEPLADGARFCVKHEADRLRMIAADAERGISL